MSNENWNKSEQYFIGIIHGAMIPAKPSVFQENKTDFNKGNYIHKQEPVYTSISLQNFYLYLQVETTDF